MLNINIYFYIFSACSSHSFLLSTSLKLCKFHDKNLVLLKHSMFDSLVYGSHVVFNLKQWLNHNLVK